MLAKPKSQVFRALENESSIVSAYDEMGSDSEDDYDWNVALNKLRRRPRQLPDDFYYANSQYGTDWLYGGDQYQAVTSPSSGLYTNTETLFSDSETSSVNSSQEAKGPSKPLWLQSRTHSDMPRMEKNHFHGELDVNFNPQATGLEYSDSSETEEVQYDLEKRSRRWRKNQALSEDLGEDKNHAKANKMNLNQVTVLCEPGGGGAAFSHALSFFLVPPKWEEAKVKCYVYQSRRFPLTGDIGNAVKYSAPKTKKTSQDLPAANKCWLITCFVVLGGLTLLLVE